MSSNRPIRGRCGAKCRNGGYCERYPINGRARCRLHGGCSTGRPITHGLRSKLVEGLRFKLGLGVAFLRHEQIARIILKYVPADERADCAAELERLASQDTIEASWHKLEPKKRRPLQETGEAEPI